MSTSDLYAGIDVGAGRVHAALVRGRVVDGLVVDGLVVDGLVAGGVWSGPVEGAAAFCRGAVRVAVDAPGGLSAGSHAGDLTVAPKFRGGRCSEVPVRGVPAVPWVTPQCLDRAPGWMRTGFEVWESLSGDGFEVVETFPAAGFHRLNGGRWPPRKSAPAGRAERLRLLGEVLGLPADAGSWGHDALDAVMCALVAARGCPAPHSCSQPDGSVMWLLDDVDRAGTEHRQPVEHG